MSTARKQYSVSIADNPDGSYTVTETTTFGNDTVTLTTELENLAALNAWQVEKIKPLLQEKAVYQELSQSKDGEFRAISSALNAIGENNYFDEVRPGIDTWAGGFSWNYLNSGDQTSAVACNIDANGFVRTIENNASKLRIVWDDKRIISARVPGQAESFEMRSLDMQWWVGMDGNNITHRMRRIRKQQ